jgi:hypothetical protein
MLAKNKTLEVASAKKSNEKKKNHTKKQETKTKQKMKL